MTLAAAADHVPALAALLLPAPPPGGTAARPGPTGAAELAAGRTGMPCAVALRDTDTGPITIVAQSAELDPRLLGLPVDPDSSAGRAVTDGVPVVARADEQVLRSDMRDRRRPVHGGVAVPIRSASRHEQHGDVAALERLADDRGLAGREALRPAERQQEEHRIEPVEEVDHLRPAAEPAGGARLVVEGSHRDP